MKNYDLSLASDIFFSNHIMYLNIHPKGLSVGDCVKRAIALASDTDYMETQRALNRYKKVSHSVEFNERKNIYGYLENVLHAKRMSFPAETGKPRMNGERFAKMYPTGRYVLNMAGHITACVDGIIYDTWDCSEKCVYNAWQIG